MGKQGAILKKCPWCSAKFEVAQEDMAFLERLSPTILGLTLQIPTPSLCPACRHQRRMTFRNDQNYYRNQCRRCKASLISIYSPDKNISILCEECYWGDGWDPLDFGREFDFSKPFFEQFAQLKAVTPRLAIFNTHSENSKYTVHSSRNRNCYIGSSLIECDEVNYSDFTFGGKSSQDLFGCKNVELCYECIDSQELFNCDYVNQCMSLSESYLCFDCRRGDSLVGCVGLRGKSFQILNKAASKFECEAVLKRLKTELKFREDFTARFNELKAHHPYPECWGNSNEEVIGNNCSHCHDIFEGHHLLDSERIRFGHDGTGNIDSMDYTRSALGELIYECAAAVELKFSAFCNLTYQCDSMLYSDNCQGGCSHCFGCMSLKRERFCILNKRYTEAQYRELVPRIVEHMKNTGEWGEFFPVALSPFGYNETKASEHFPLTEAEIAEKGWQWSSYQSPAPKDLKSIKASDLSFAIGEVPDTIVEYAILSELSDKPFRILQGDLLFHRKKELPLPRLTPRERHSRRILELPPHTLTSRQCGHCEREILTPYFDQSKIARVYCLKCYEQYLHNSEDS